MEDSEKITQPGAPVSSPCNNLPRRPPLLLGVFLFGFGAAALLCPRGAMAQTQSTEAAALNPKSGLVVTPFVSLETLYDSNIFATSGQRESDTILRLSPGIGVGYSSSRSSFNLLYTFDAERYSRHSDLNTWQARQAGLVGGTYRFTNRFTGGISTNYLESYYPGELTPVSGVELARTRATRISVRPTATYQFNPRTSATFFYDRAREHVATGTTTYISVASGAVTRDLTQRDRLTLQYQSYWYDFNTGGSPISRLFTVGWERKISRETSLFITAGPRDTDGRTTPEVYAGITRDTGRSSQSFSYRRSQLTLVGESQVYDTSTWAASFGFRPSPRWALNVMPGYSRVYRGGIEAKVYRLGLTARYWFARDWALGLNYNYSRQDGLLLTGSSNELIFRNVISLSLTWALPTGPGHATLPSRQDYGLPNAGGGR